MTDLRELDKLAELKTREAEEVEAKAAKLRRAAKAHSHIIDTIHSIIEGTGALFDEEGNPTNTEETLEGPLIPQGRIAGQRSDSSRYFFARAFATREHWRAVPETEAYILGKLKEDPDMRNEFFRTNGKNFGVRYYFGDESGQNLRFLKEESVPRAPHVGGVGGGYYLTAVDTYTPAEMADFYDKDANGSRVLDQILDLDRTLTALAATEATDGL